MGSQSLISGTSLLQMASQCSKVKVARAQQTRATLPASATPFGMTTTSLPLTVRLLTHLCLPFQLHARAHRSSAHFLELATFSNPKMLEASRSGIATLKPRLVLQFFLVWTMSYCTAVYTGCACSIFLVSVDSMETSSDRNEGDLLVREGAS